jgi:peptide-methionine (S)-S-oxide reductase
MVLRKLIPMLLAALPAFALVWVASTRAADAPVAAPAPLLDNHRAAGPLQSAVLAGGCFWGMQGVFEHVRGVHRVLAGYSGGPRESAQYENVGTGRTGHAESIQVLFDPAQVSYGELLQVYFSVAHDPTELNHQGPDSGSQYRSAIFYADDLQRQIAQSYIAQLDKAHVFTRPIVTQVDTLHGFYPAEDYHQDFYLKNPDYPYIVVNDLPKISSLKRLFPQYYRDAPVQVASR